MNSDERSTCNISIELKPEQHLLIERACGITGMGVAEFILDAACREAKNIACNQSSFELTEEKYTSLKKFLAKPAKDNPALRELLNSRSPWATHNEGELLDGMTPYKAHDELVFGVPDEFRLSAYRVFLKIVDEWALTVSEIQTVLNITPEAFQRLATSPSASIVDNEMLERISLVLGIWAELHSIYHDYDIANGWLRRLNNDPVFKNKPPITYLLTGDTSDLAFLRRYLYTRATGGYV